jgi:2-polyprenyl-3-methyl-5-hydroxy-6-metoxy-1,4-benzoquinol methylase
MSESFDPSHQAEFDRYATSYDAMHAESISASGEGTEYFAIYKQKVLERLLGPGFNRPVLDFGCGIGNLTRLLVESFPTVHGYDPSSQCVKLARERTPKAAFFEDTEDLPKGHYGAIVLANVLHHVPPSNRPGLLQTVVRGLAPQGRLVIFEHNPLNPVTRRAVAACPFDEGVELLYPWEVTRLLQAAGLASIHRDFIVFFPRFLAAARSLEPRLAWLPLGAQVCAWGMKK